ncbi:MAG: hypothetical protein ACRDN6_06825 [Gaiellaceae bacterium]
MPTPFRLLTRRAGPIGLALTAYDLWRRLPPKQRKQLLDSARKHGPRLASEAMKRRQARRNMPPRP